MENIEMLQKELEEQQRQETKLVEEIGIAEKTLSDKNKLSIEHERIQNKINDILLKNQKNRDILKSLKNKTENCKNLIGNDTVENLNKRFVELQTESEELKRKIDDAVYNYDMQVQKQRELSEMKRRIDNQKKRNSTLKEKLDSIKANKG